MLDLLLYLYCTSTRTVLCKVILTLGNALIAITGPRLRLEALFVDKGGQTRAASGCPPSVSLDPCRLGPLNTGLLPTQHQKAKITPTGGKKIHNGLPNVPPVGSSHKTTYSTGTELSSSR